MDTEFRFHTLNGPLFLLEICIMDRLIKNVKMRKAFRPDPKTEAIMIRVSPAEKNKIRQAAKSVNLPMGGYLLKLHRYAVGKK